MTHKWLHRYELKPDRWVFAPTDDAKKTGTLIKRKVEAHWMPPDFYFHFRAGGHVAAIHAHAESFIFFRADLDDFFGKVNRSRITRWLKDWFPYAEARAMASESVVKRPGTDAFVLPYGFVQSPILASLALDRSKLGALLRKLHKRNDLRVSVYVDDIIISGNDAATIRTVSMQLIETAKLADFPLSSTKTEGPAASVTAFNIELKHKDLRISDSRFSSLRTDYQEATSTYSRAGIFGYVHSVNPDQANGLA